MWISPSSISCHCRSYCSERPMKPAICRTRSMAAGLPYTASRSTGCSMLNVASSPPMPRMWSRCSWLRNTCERFLKPQPARVICLWVPSPQSMSHFRSRYVTRVAETLRFTVGTAAEVPRKVMPKVVLIADLPASISATGPRRLPGATGRDPSPTPAWWRTAAARRCGRSRRYAAS